MEIAKHNEIMNKLRNSEITEVERNNLLLDLANDYKNMTIQVETLTADKEQLQKDNLEYSQLNNKLFLQVTASNKPQLEPDQEVHEEPEKKMTFEELFED